MGFYHSDTVSISPFESTAWDFESRQSMKVKHRMTVPFVVSDILISHMLVSSTLNLYFIMHKNAFSN